MVKFLINRPIAVTMTFIAILIMGVLAVTYIPVSLMPDIDIPEITVQVQRKNVSARELESSIINPLRRHLINLSHLTDISSETRDEKSTISLKFEYGTKVDFAFIEVNEKIDRAMSQFPKDTERPRVIKASATDIPVFYLNLSLKDDGRNDSNAPLESDGENNLLESKKSASLHHNQGPLGRDDDNGLGDVQVFGNARLNFENTSGLKDLYPVSQKFAELSGFSTQVIRKRIEQLSEVAMVDVSGLVYPELLIMPDLAKMDALGISLEQLENHIRNNNVNFGNLLIKDGQYQYNVRFNTSLSNKKDIEDLYIKTNGRLFRLKELVSVIEHPQKLKGLVTSNGKDAISMAIIKQSDARMGKLEEKLKELVGNFHKEYPEIDFTITRDQTKLLKHSISNLGQDLFWGASLAFLVMFLFLRDIKSPLLIGITIPSSLILSILLFHLAGISINVISLSGLVLGIGMMIDNSIIVIDNITQHREKTGMLSQSCISGANEVFFPMLSSSLTTCAVFLPLIFMSGITGALFYDEAMAVTIGTSVSLCISVVVIPVYYKIFYSKGNPSEKNKWFNKVNGINYEALYEKSFKWVMRHHLIIWVIILGMTTMGIMAFLELPKSRLPYLTKDEIILDVEWNEKINVQENKRRTEELMTTFADLVEDKTAYIGEQQFLLDHKNSIGPSEAYVYFKVKNADDLPVLINSLRQEISQHYPYAVYRLREAGTTFNIIFPEEDPPLVAKLRPTKDYGPKTNDFLMASLQDLQNEIPDLEVPAIPWQEHLVLNIDPVKMMAYDISQETLFAKLQTSFNERLVFKITDNQFFTPVVIGGKPNLISEILSVTYIANKEGKMYPVRDLLSLSKDQDLKVIRAGQEGEYFPVPVQVSEKAAESLMDKIRLALKANNYYEADFVGSIFSNREMVKELSLIIIISLTLLYFILAAQFESLSLPIIVLLEVPIDILGAFIFLKICGAGINLMSLIGLVVMSGIIINDSILKIDTINKLVKEGYSVIGAMMRGGQRRLKPILMTSITTILAMIPLLFTSGLGAELQRPLALALVGGMTIGTMISLYFIPLCYYYLKKI